MQKVAGSNAAAYRNISAPPVERLVGCHPLSALNVYYRIYRIVNYVHMPSSNYILKKTQKNMPWHFAPTISKCLQEDTQSLLPLRSTCPNHLNLPCLTTTVTASTFKRLFKSSLDILLLRLVPHIHLTIMRSVLFSRCISSAFTDQVNIIWRNLQYPITNLHCTLLHCYCLHCSLRVIS